MFSRLVREKACPACSVSVFVVIQFSPIHGNFMEWSWVETREKKGVVCLCVLFVRLFFMVKQTSPDRSQKYWMMTKPCPREMYTACLSLRANYKRKGNGHLCWKAGFTAPISGAVCVRLIDWFECDTLMNQSINQSTMSLQQHWSSLRVQFAQ